MQHKHGGTILQIKAIAHETYKRVATWHYICRVQWDDGTISESCDVAPWALRYDSDDDADTAAYKRAAEILNDYLFANGTWLDEPRHMRDGRIVHWVPNKPNGNSRYEP